MGVSWLLLCLISLAHSAVLLPFLIVFKAAEMARSDPAVYRSAGEWADGQLSITLNLGNFCN